MPSFQGSGQGNGASGAISIYDATNTIIINILCTEGYEAHFISSILMELVDISGFDFVDNTDLIHMDADLKTTVIELSTLMQHAIDLREHILRLIGGTIFPEKSWVHPISFSWYAS